jgi:hypothetical protein
VATSLSDGRFARWNAGAPTASGLLAAIELHVAAVGRGGQIFVGRRVVRSERHASCELGRQFGAFVVGKRLDLFEELLRCPRQLAKMALVLSTVVLGASGYESSGRDNSEKQSRVGCVALLPRR